MAISKIQSESMNLADAFAFTGTVTGAGGNAGLVHLETQVTTTAVADIKFGADVFNTTYDKYVVKGRVLPATNSARLYYRFLNNAEADLTATDSYRYARNNSSGDNYTFALIAEETGTHHEAETGVLFLADIWLPHVGDNDYQSMVFARAFRVSGGTQPRDDTVVSYFRSDRDTTQPEGIKFYWSTGNIAKASISVFGVSEG
jgi:hypothetical protein